MMTPEQRREIIRLLEQDEELSPEWARILFSPEKREYELVYHGKDREEDILANTLAVPLQPVRTFGGSGRNGNGEWQNMLIFGDNLQVMKSLLEMKKAGKLCNADGTPGVQLVYIDPPFATKQEFRGTEDQKAYQDKIAGSEFIEFLRKRLVLMREILSDNGSIYIHLDIKKVHYIKTIMDEVFGEQNFVNEVIWQRTASHNDPGRYGNIHDSILFYKKGGSYLWNEPKMEQSENYIESFFVYAESPDRKQWIKLKKGETPPDGWERYRLGNFASPHPRPNLIYEYKGYKPPKNGWKVNLDRMVEMDKQGLLHFPKDKHGRIQPKQYLRDTIGNKAVPDVWVGINPLQSQGTEKQNYPTQKPEQLIARIIQASSDEGDIVLDTFAGSGTALSVAEKLGRRWIGIDCGKLAIYTMQKRMLNLREEVGNKGKPLKPKPFTLYNAGLYDFSRLRELPWESWRFFALQLFQCRDEPHTIGGIKLDGYLKGASVLVFNHMKEKGVRIDEETIESLHEALGTRVGSRLFVIAPALTFDFQQDYINLDGVRYYALRIPYSIIHELHQREFTALKQPSDEMAVNDTVEAVGFDFIRTPELKFECGVGARKGELFEEGFIRIKTFKSEAVVRESVQKKGNLETLSMVMLDYDFDETSQIFDLDAVFYADALEKANWEMRFPVKTLGKKLMAVFIDIYGNEARVLIDAEQFQMKAKNGKAMGAHATATSK
jgi:site-specific DNA-methyltransferase (adenine-specific)/adenine-specific DNA-methyltransferase